MTKDTQFHNLSTLGHKILLRDYECPKGKVDFVTKHEGTLHLFGSSDTEKVAKYYLKRYGIKDVQCILHIEKEYVNQTI